MSSLSAILGSALFFLVAPVLIAGVVPWWVSHWSMQEPLFGLSFTRMLGVFLILIGIPVLLESFARFALQGRGTPAPIAPTRHLVVTGSYTRVRNPIYLAVVSIILGQGLLLGSVALLAYGAILALGFHIFVLAYEEPTLRTTFGDEFEEYCARVPRWVPRLRPWQAHASKD
jgi:protein-S-isoprenylcysteine O-methyltransferase Ste14